MKKYRPNVAAIVLSSDYPKKVEFFIAERSDVADSWQFPQGGIDEGENPKEALLRELKEEIGTDQVEIVAEYPEWVSYDFPKTIARKMYPYDGQRQKYFWCGSNRALKSTFKQKCPSLVVTNSFHTMSFLSMLPFSSDRSTKKC